MTAVDVAIRDLHRDGPDDDLAAFARAADECRRLLERAFEAARARLAAFCAPA